MKQSSKILLLLCVAATLISCQVLFGPRINGSGKVIEVTRQPGEFGGVDLAGMGLVVVEMGENPSVTIETDDNLMEYLLTEVKNGVLKIRTKDNVNLDPSGDIKYRIVTTRLSSVTLSGSGEIRTPEVNTPEEFFKIELSGSGSIVTENIIASSTDIELSGSGSVDVARVQNNSGRSSADVQGSGHINIGRLESKSFDGLISGSGKLNIDGGHVEFQNIVINGSGKYLAKSFASKDARVDIPGSGAARIKVSDSLGVSITGSGSVGYIGNPEIDHSIVGSGTVYQLDN